MLSEDLTRLLENALRPAAPQQFTLPPDGPQSLDEFVGQPRAIARLRAALASARARDTRLDHTLLLGGSGLGKSTLARLLAHEAGANLVELAGKVGAEEARPAIEGLNSGDFVFIDEAHALGRRGGDWLLHLLQDGALVTPFGRQQMPDVTVILATTDAGALPGPLLNRFVVRITLEPHTRDDAAALVTQIARRSGVEDPPVDRIVRATQGRSRDIRALLLALRDARLYGATDPFDVALEFAGLTDDGLTVTQVNYLLALAIRCGGRAGQATLQVMLNEPGGLSHVEGELIQRGFVTVAPGGRQVTQLGIQRAKELAAQKLRNHD